jgi:hypothetical protein
MTDDQRDRIEAIRQRMRDGASDRTIAAEFGVSHWMIRQVRQSGFHDDPLITIAAAWPERGYGTAITMPEKS